MLTSFLIVSIVTSVAQILQQRVQLRQIVVEGRHLPSAAAFRDALLDGLAVLISRLQQQFVVRYRSFSTLFIIDI